MNRPFDDQAQPRIRLEAEAILLILSRFESGEWTWIGSEVMRYEVDQTPNHDRRLRVSTLMEPIGRMIEVGDAEVVRVGQLEAMGFQAFDSLHIACAEVQLVDVFLTTDDRLLQVAKRVGESIKIRVANPLSWLTEVNEP